MAPELTTGRAYLGPPVDLWALGAMAFELTCGRHAFRGESLQQLHVRVRRVSHQPFHPNTSAGARSLVKQLLVQEPSERLSAEEVLAHVWLDAAGRRLGGTPL